MKRVIEDFVCKVCGEKVVGDGYTDHCPKCLWGRHVDEMTPGDRSSDCGGLMRPIRTIYQADKFKILYKCEKCNHEFLVRAADAKAMAGRGRTKEDNRDLLVKLAAE